MRNLDITLLLITLIAASPLMALDLSEEPVENSIQILVNSPELAVQGDVSLTIADLEAYLSRIPEEHRGGFLRSRDRVGRALENLMLPRLIAADATANGMLADQGVQGQLYQSAVVLIAQEYMTRYFTEQALEDYSTLARELYLTEPERFQSAPTIGFTHVLVQVGVDKGELEGMELIVSVYERLQAGESLDDLAVELSDDPSVTDNQGSYSEVDPSTLDPAVATALSVMSVGDISEPVRSEFGWHVLRLDEETPGQQLDWEDARDEAINLAREEHLQTVRERLVQRLRVGQMEVDVPLLQEFLDQYELEWRLFPEEPESPMDQQAQR